MMVICVVGDLKPLRMFYIRTRRYSGRGIGRLGVGVVILEEQKIVRDNECPNCKCKEQRCISRTKGEITYIVYVCVKCKTVVRRELT